MANQLDRRVEGDHLEPLTIERSREQVAAEIGEGQQECLMVCGLLTLGDKLSDAGTG
jgi:hypothetical protein